jgi:hypothetical protein
VGAAIVGEGFFRRPLNARHGLLHREDVLCGTPQFHDDAGGYVLVCNNALRGPSSRHQLDESGLAQEGRRVTLDGRGLDRRRRVRQR